MDLDSGQIILFTAEGRCNGQKIMFTHHYFVEQVTGVIEMQEGLEEFIDLRMSDAGADIFQTDYLNCLPDNYALERFTAQCVYPVRSRKFIREIADAGNIANDALTPNLAAVIELWTELAGRSQVSCKHIGPLAQSVGWYVDGVLHNDYKVLLGLLKDVLTDDVTIAARWSFLPCIFHRDPDAEPYFDYIIAGQVQETVRTMRRRTVGLGE